MNAVKNGLIQRRDTTARMLPTTQIAISPTIDRASRPKNDLFGATRASGGYSPYALHDHGLDRDIVEAALAAGLDRRNLVDDVHAFSYPRENGVAKVAARVIEEVVVLQVDEELRGCAVYVVGARHRERAAFILQAVVRLVLDGRLCALMRHVFGEAAALDDEAWNDPVEDRPVEEFVLDIAQKIGNRLGSLFIEELYGEIAQRGFEADHEGFLMLCENGSQRDAGPA